MREVMRAPGVLDAALGWYRQALMPDAEALARATPIVSAAVPVPTLGIVGADDGCVSAEIFTAGMDAANYPAGVQVAVVPVTSGSGVRLKVIEALATGVPVATTPLGAQGATELVGRGLAVGATAEALAGAIGTWLLHPDRRAEAAAEARVAALEYFDMGRQLDALEALLATVTRTDEINPTAV
ncbi:MAG: glycosyltransferase [Bacteroidia bacterium]|nr:glycosyltransferase [Bacteroidia bacterium]